MIPPRHAPAAPAGPLRTFGPASLAVYETPFATIPVLRVSGTPLEMGHQYGFLVGDRVRRIADMLVSIFTEAGLPEFVVHNLLDNAWARMLPHTPERFLEEITGIAQGAAEAGVALTEQDLFRIVAATNLDLYKRDERAFEFISPDILEMLQNPPKLPEGMSCTMFAVWGARTVDGKMFSMRNLDWLSQTGMHAERLVTVYTPAEGIPCVTTGYAGVIGALAGMNARGITLSEVGAFSVREELDGTPWTLMARQLLEQAACLEDAVRIISSATHTIGYNYLIADGDPENYGTAAFRPCAAAFETNHETCEVFFENDPKEATAVWESPDGKKTPYGLPLTEAVMRADTAFGPKARALQAADDGPGDPENTGNPLGRDGAGSTYTTCHKPMHDMIRAYETGAEYVFPVRGTKVIEAGAPRRIGPEEAMTIAATVAHNTEMLPENDWNVMSVVYAPTDGKLWLGFEHLHADGNWTNAPDSGYMEFTAADLFD